MMHYFSINSETNQHLGFLVLMEDEEFSSQRHCGYLKIKAQAESMTQQEYPQLYEILKECEQYSSLTWQKQGEKLMILDDKNKPIGTIQQQYLSIREHEFILNDLIGNCL